MPARPIAVAVNEMTGLCPCSLTGALWLGHDGRPHKAARFSGSCTPKPPLLAALRVESVARPAKFGLPRATMPSHGMPLVSFTPQVARLDRHSG